MEANRFELISSGDREQRNRLFEQFRNSTEPTERQVVKFTQTEETEEGLYRTLYYVAYPSKVTKQNHGSARNPRKFPGRKR